MVSTPRRRRPDRPAAGPTHRPAAGPTHRPAAGPALWVAVVLVCAALGALAVPALGETAPPDPDDLDAGDRAADLGLPPGGEPVEGARLYDQLCARCHGPAGRGGERAPSLREIDIARLDLVLRTNRMPPATETGQGRGPVDWERDERVDLLTYAAGAFDLTGSIPRPGLGDPTVGRRLYADNCASCHGYTGDGGVAGGGAFTPRVAGHDPVTIAEAIRVGPFQMPQFGSFQVPDDNLDDVAAYLHTVAEEEGTPLLGLVELNPVYASALVAAFAVIVLISCVWLGGRVLMFPDPAARNEDAEPAADDAAPDSQQGTDAGGETRGDGSAGEEGGPR